MQMKTLIAAAVAGAFAMPFAAQVSADNDTMILAQASGSSGGAAGTGGAVGAAQGSAGGQGEGNPGGGRTIGFPPSDITQLDKNNDGYVSRDEMGTHPAAGTFDDMDKDRDQRLSRDEWAAGSAAAGASGDPSPDRVGELGRHGTTGGKAGWPPTNIQLLDKDKDEHISREEAGGDREVMSRFGQLDANNDGRLSRSEWEAGTAATGGTTK